MIQNDNQYNGTTHISQFPQDPGLMQYTSCLKIPAYCKTIQKINPGYHSESPRSMLQYDSQHIHGGSFTIKWGNNPFGRIKPCLFLGDSGKTL